MIKRILPPGFTFKGYPAQFQHTDERRIMKQLLNMPSAAEIIRTQGDRVRFGLRVHVYAYPEDTLAVWLHLCVSYRSVL